MDFFAGCGGMSLGIIKGGFEVVAAVEWDCAAALTYMTNLCHYGELQIHCVTEADRVRLENYIGRMWSSNGASRWTFPTAGKGWIAGEPQGTPGVGHFFFGDVRQLTAERILGTLEIDVGELDLIAGSPPCQGFSKAGKQRIADERNDLTFEFARFIVELRPKAMIMENVPDIMNMMTPDGVPVLDKFCRILEDGHFGGYDAFLKSIEQQTGRVGLLRGHKRSPESQPAARPKAATDQSDLFEAAL
jgi:DNA (cytosine-5)-methyltransferase 1